MRSPERYDAFTPPRSLALVSSGRLEGCAAADELLRMRGNG